MIVIGGYLVLTAIMTYPLMLQFATAIPGDGGDGWQNYWNVWWLKRSLLDLGSNPYWTAEVYYPDGTFLFFNSLLVLPGILALPIVNAFGLTMSYNFLVLLGFVLGGYGMYLLTVYLLTRGESPAKKYRVLAAFLAGAVFTFSSYHFVRLLGHLEQVSLQWLPFYTLYLVKSWREPGWRNVLLAVLFFVLAALTTWYFALDLLLLTLVLVVYSVVVERQRAWAYAVTRIAMVIALSALVLAPVLIPMLILGRTMGRVGDPASDSLRFSADLLAYFVPSPLRTFGGTDLKPLYQLLTRDGDLIEGVVFLGFVPLLFAVVAVWSFGRRTTFWLVTLLFFAILALGPVLHSGGQTVTLFDHSIPLPYKIFLRLPYGDIMRVPSRFTILTTLSLAVLAAYGAMTLLNRAPRASLAGLGFGIGLMLILLENAVVPYPMTPVSIPPVYTLLGQTQQRVALLEVPIPDNPGIYPLRMLYQTRHEKPIYGGYLSRGLPPAYLTALPGFAQFKSLSPEWEDIVSYIGANERELGLASLNFYNAGYVVVDKSLLSPSQLAAARGVANTLFQGAMPGYEDETTLVYVVPPAVPTEPLLFLYQGWYGLEKAPPNASPETPAHWRWMPSEASLNLVAPRAGQFQVEFRASSFRETRHLAVFVDETLVATFPVHPENAIWQTPPFIVAAGEHQIRLESIEPPEIPGAGDTRPLTIAVAEIRLVNIGP